MTRSDAVASAKSARVKLEAMLLDLPGLERRPSRYGDSFAYFVGNREIAHFHGDGRMDVRLTREVIKYRKSEGGFDRRVRTRGPSADWVSVSIENSTALPYVLSLVEEALRANG